MVPHDYLYGLRSILRTLESQGFESSRPGNGPAYNSELFRVHPWADYDCECGQEDKRFTWEMAAKHSAGCFMGEVEKRAASNGRELFDDIDEDLKEAVALAKELGITYQGLSAHCSCDMNERRKAADLDCRETCAAITPNFNHKPTGFSLEWYKHMGRGLKVLNPVSAEVWDRIVLECLAEAIEARP